MKSTSVSLARALPQADGPAARLRRCAGAVRRGAVNGSAWSGAFRLEAEPQVPTTAEHLVLTVRSTAGAASLVVAPLQWPGMSSAATLTDSRRRDAVATMLLREVLGEFGHLLVSAELRPVPVRAAVTSGLVVWCGSLRLEVLEADDSLLRSVEDSLARLTGGLPPSAQALLLPCRLRIGRRRMSRESLCALRISDVVLLPASPDTPVLLTWGDRARRPLQAAALLQASTMTLIDAPHLTDDDDPPGGAQTDPQSPQRPSAPDPSSTAAARALSRLELPVEFDLAGPHLSLADIAMLVSGDVLELPVPVEHAQVRISVAQQRIGLGELVAVGGRLGVRILAIDIARPDDRVQERAR